MAEDGGEGSAIEVDRRGRPLLEAGIMTAREVVDLIKKQAGTWNEQSYRDVFHGGNPDSTVVGELRSVGIKGGENANMRPGIMTIPETTFGEFAAQVRRVSGFRAIRCVGDPKAKVSKVLVGPGYGTPRITPEVDVVIGGEQQEADGGFDNVEYVLDAASLGMAKGVIMLGHLVSEQAGM